MFCIRQINSPISYRWIDGCGVVNGSRGSMTIRNSFAIACMGFPFSCGTNPNVFVTLLPDVNHPTSVNEKLEACIQSVTVVNLQAIRHPNVHPISPH